MSPAQPPSHPRLNTTLLLFLLVLVALLLRIFRLDHQSLWYDEAFSVVTSSAPLPDMMRQLISDFVHPPLYYLVLHALHQLHELGSASARAVSVVFGLASIPLLYYAGKWFYDRQTGLLAALLLTLSQLAVMYSQEARPYALQMFTISLVLYGFALAIKQHSSLGWWCAVCAALLSIYTQYYSLFVLAPLLLWAITERRGIGTKNIVIALVLAVICYLPWLGSGIIDAALHAEKTTGEQPDYFAISWATIFDVLNRYNNGSIDNLLLDGPHWLYFVGACLFTAPALVAGAGRHQFSSRAVTGFWLLGALVLGLFTAAFGGSKAGLVLTALYLMRAGLAALPLVGRDTLPGYRLATSTRAWLVILVAAFAICLHQNAYAWVFSMLGLMLGAIGLGHLQRAHTGASPRDTSSASVAQGYFLLLSCLFGIGAPILLGIIGMQFDTRYTLSALPVYYLLVAAGIAAIKPARLRLSLVVVICLYSLFALRANYFSPYKENWRDSMALVISNYEAGDCVTMSPSWRELPNTWYAYRYERQLPNINFISAKEIVAAAAQCPRIWFLQYGRVGSSVEDGIPLREGVEQLHVPLREWHYHWVDVTLYENRQTRRAAN